MQQSPEDHPKMRSLEEILRRLQPGLVAVSGGVDSRFLAALTVRYGLDYRAVFFSGPQMTPGEKAQAVDSLEDIGLGFDLLPVNPLQTEAVLRNDRQRCYVCKKSLFRQALQHGQQLGRPAVVEGSHLSDRSGYRPGLKALSELGISSPLAEAGFSKADIRHLAGEIGLQRPDQPSRPCLLTRFAYGYGPGQTELERLGRAEDELLELGLAEFRIRIPDQNRILLQLIPAEADRAKRLQAGVRRVMEQNRLAPFEIFVTETVSGFFD